MGKNRLSKMLYGTTLIGLLTFTGCNPRREYSLDINSQSSNAVVNLPVSRGGSSPQIIAADFNNDGTNDLAIVQQEARDGYATRVYVLYNDGNGNFSHQLPRRNN